MHIKMKISKLLRLQEFQTNPNPISVLFVRHHSQSSCGSILKLMHPANSQRVLLEVTLVRPAEGLQEVLVPVEKQAHTEGGFAKQTECCSKTENNL